MAVENLHHEFPGQTHVRSDILNSEWLTLARVRVSRSVRIVVQVVEPPDNHETVPGEVEAVGQALIWAAKVIERYKRAAARKRQAKP